MPDPNPTQIVPSNIEQSSIQTIEAPQSPFMNRVEPIQKSTSILNWESSPKPVIQQSTKGSQEEPHCLDNCICTCWLKGKDPYYNYNFTRAQRLEAGANCWDCCCCPHDSGDLSGTNSIFKFARATTKSQKNTICCLWIFCSCALPICSLLSNCTNEGASNENQENNQNLLNTLSKCPKMFYDICIGKLCGCCKDIECSCDCNICSEASKCFFTPCRACYEKCC